MILETFQYRLNKGWTVPFLPNLDSENTLVLVFSAPEFFDHPDPIKALADQYPQSKIIGCSSAGEIHGDGVFDDTLSVTVVRFERTRLRSCAVSVHNSHGPFEGGQSLANTLSEPDLAGIFVLSDGAINGSELVKGLNTLAKKNVVITGGMAGDGNRFQRTWVVHEGKIHMDQVVAVGFYGQHIRIGHGSRGGWDVFGTERRITRSKNNVLYELDNKSALSLYKTYLGEKAQGLPATGLLYPLRIRKDINDPKHLVRTILSVDEKEGSLIFAGDMPTGYLAQLMRANFDRLITGAKEAGELVLASDGVAAITGQHYRPILLIAISCVGRRLLLGERIEEETENVLSLFPKTTRMVGFYSYGELSPYSRGDCDLHNQTMTLTSLYEAE